MFTHQVCIVGLPVVIVVAIELGQLAGQQIVHGLEIGEIPANQVCD